MIAALAVRLKLIGNMARDRLDILHDLFRIFENEKIDLLKNIMLLLTVAFDGNVIGRVDIAVGYCRIMLYSSLNAEYLRKRLKLFFHFFGHPFVAHSETKKFF